MTGPRAHLDELTEKERGYVDSGVRRLVVFWEGGSVSVRLPATGNVVIGRALECEVAVDHKTVSRRHTMLRVGDELTVEDLGSANGTRVRGTRIEPGRQVPIAMGEVVEIGGTVGIVQAIAADGAAIARGSSKDARAIGASEGIVVAAPAMRELHQLVGMVAKSPVDVLIVGETGVGKDVVANEIHRRSSRASFPFVTLNCAAMPETLLESELFGYEKGAFTGADRSKPGILEAAQGGTLFLDELGEMPSVTQAKLLRAVETRQVTRLGSTKTIAIDVRFVSATNAELERRMADGSFRSDLYFRLNGITLQVPPLRERVEEIEPLARAFLAQHARAAKVPAPELSVAAAERLRAHIWPGNIRELRHVMGQALIFADGARTIEPAHLRALGALGAAPTSVRPPPASAAASAPAAGLRDTLDAVERARIEEALATCSGNQTRAAAMLGISRRTLLNRLDAYGLPRPRK